MGKRYTLMSVVIWCLWWLVFTGLSQGCETEPGRAVQGEPRGRHRLQLLFPLLMRISSRLATLVPTAIMILMGVLVFIVFSKKAFIVSLIALFLTISEKLKKNEEIYIHKINTYPEYNDEEHIHYHHQGWPKDYTYRRNDEYKYTRKTLPVLPHISQLFPLHATEIRPFKPLPILNVTRRADLWMNKDPATFPAFKNDNGNWYFRKTE